MSPALLKQNLDEELAAAEKITAVGASIFEQSAEQPEEEPKKPKTSKEKTSAAKSRRRRKEGRPSTEEARLLMIVRSVWSLRVSAVMSYITA